MVGKLKSISFYTSLLVMVLGFILLVPLILSIYFGEMLIYQKAFLSSATLSFLIGFIVYTLTKASNKNINLVTSMLLCAISWLVISIIGGLPFIFALNKSFIDAFFESVSGFTTTGITVFEGLDTMALSMIFWRALIQWLGGLGILTFFLFITFNSEGDIWQLFAAEGHKINSSRPFPNVNKTIKILWLIYAFLTLVETGILSLLGLSFFDALTHSMTSLSTGGFSRYDTSVAYFSIAGYKHYKAIEYIITLFMLFGGTNFLVHYKILTGRFSTIYRDTENRNYLLIITAFTSLIITSIFLANTATMSSFEEIFRKTIFQVISVITTTGFGTQDIGSSFFPALAKQLFLILMVIGGCVGSTSGGIKVIRATILTRLFKREIKRISYPQKAIIPVVVDKNIIPENEIYRISGLFFAWLLIIIVGSGITAVFSDLDAFQAFSGMISAMGNIGPFYFSVAKMATLNPLVKLTFIFGMLAGRLEILPIIVLFTRKSWID